MVRHDSRHQSRPLPCPACLAVDLIPTRSASEANTSRGRADVTCLPRWRFGLVERTKSTACLAGSQIRQRCSCFIVQNFPCRLDKPTGAASCSFPLSNYKSSARARQACTGRDQLSPKKTQRIEASPCCRSRCCRSPCWDPIVRPSSKGTDGECVSEKSKDIEKVRREEKKAPRR